jgi:hypothetical protein
VKIEDESTPKAKSELLLRRIAREVDGVVVGVSQALELMSYFRSRSVLQRSAFRGNLQISPLVQIPVCLGQRLLQCNAILGLMQCRSVVQQVWMFVKASEQKFPTMKKLSIVSEQCMWNTHTHAHTLSRSHCVHLFHQLHTSV